MSLENIEQLAKDHAKDREKLAALVGKCNQEISDVRRLYRLQLIKAVANVRDSHARLVAEVDANRALFVRPRTRILHTIRVGLKKGTGKLCFASAQRVVELIRKHLPDQAEVLIHTKEEPRKEALLGLDAKELKKLGCTVEGTGDQVVVRTADTEIDKLVDALLAADEEFEEE